MHLYLIPFSPAGTCVRSAGSVFSCPICDFARWAAVDFERGGGVWVIGGDGGEGEEDGRSLGDIFKLVDEKVGRKGAMEVVEPPAEVIKSELFMHQKDALGWMVNRENGCELPPFWEERDGGYVNVLTNYQTDTRPLPIRGGIFADDMGLGKTLTLLSLIALDRYGSGSTVSSFESGRVNVEQCEEIGEGNDGLVVSGARKAKRGRGGKNYSKSRKKSKL